MPIFIPGSLPTIHNYTRSLSTRPGGCCCCWSVLRKAFILLQTIKYHPISALITSQGQRVSLSLVACACHIKMRTNVFLSPLSSATAVSSAYLSSHTHYLLQCNHPCHDATSLPSASSASLPILAKPFIASLNYLLFSLQLYLCRYPPPPLGDYTLCTAVSLAQYSRCFASKAQATLTLTAHGDGR